MKFDLLLLSFLITAISAAPIPGPSGRGSSSGRSGQRGTSSGSSRGRGTYSDNHSDNSRVINADIESDQAPYIAENLRNHVTAYGPETLQKHGYDQNSKSEKAHLRYDAKKQNERINGKKPYPDAEVEEMPPASTRHRDDPVTTKWVPHDDQQHQARVYADAMRQARPNDEIHYGIVGEDIHGSSGGYSGSHQSGNSGHDTRYGGSHEPGYYGDSGSRGSSGYSKRTSDEMPATTDVQSVAV